MAKATVTFNISTILGAILMIAGLIILVVISWNAYQLAVGSLQPLEIRPDALTSTNAILYGIVLQIGMFAVLVGVAYTLMRFGMTVTQRKEKETRQQDR